MGLVVFKVFEFPVEAHVLKSMLEAEEIPAYIFDEYTLGVDPILGQALGGVKLMVNDFDVERALELLEEKEQQYENQAEETGIFCPKCNSTHLINNFYTYDNFWDVISMIFSFLFFVFPIHVSKRYKCKDCGTVFKYQSSH